MTELFSCAKKKQKVNFTNAPHEASTRNLIPFFIPTLRSESSMHKLTVADQY